MALTACQGTSISLYANLPAGYQYLCQPGLLIVISMQPLRALIFNRNKSFNATGQDLL